MALKAVVFDFNGIIINDESIHEKLILELLLEENLRPDRSEFQRVCLGRSDRVCLQEILENRGRYVTEEYLSSLMQRKAQAYQRELERLEKLPIYNGLNEFILKLRVENLKLALVSGALRTEIEMVLDRIQLKAQFPVIVAGDDIVTSKPEPDGYLLAVDRLNEVYPSLNLKPSECLAIEDTPAGIEAARRAEMQVLGVANTYPAHMLQRQVDWVVDYLAELELDRVRHAFETQKRIPLDRSEKLS
ncbi:MAG: HAD family phosphatase [Cyanobacteria bacterium SID2]|nr:HAD family phosphatase [Cyanobacteria bacterium SID2]MBP0003131.1 HAD family phosphatase [Cyanobacteria bacterium SBC]